MSEDKKPEKIRIDEILEEGGDTSAGLGEIEVLDPGAPAPPESREPQRRASTAGAAGRSVEPASDEELAAARSERDKYHDLWIRSRADFDNLLKRIEREREQERGLAEAALVKEMLPVVDNLDRALEQAPRDDPFRDGVALIHRQMKECLLRAGLEPIEAVGEPFDPLYHEAVAGEATTRLPHNTVIEEAQKGYRFKGRVMRHALVKVALNPGEKNTQGAADEAGGVNPGDEESG
jgi:molecular chaperone GrpE